MYECDIYNTFPILLLLLVLLLLLLLLYIISLSKIYRIWEKRRAKKHEGAKGESEGKERRAETERKWMKGVERQITPSNKEY